MATIFRPPLFNVRREIDPTQTGINAQFGVQFNINLFPPPPPQIPPGKSHYTRPDPIYWSNTWTQSLVLTTLAGQDRMTVGKQYTERPPPVNWRAGQTLSLVLTTLRSQDAMNPGEQLTDLPPRDYQRPQQLRTWLHSYNLNLIGKDFMPPGEQRFDLPPRDHERTNQLRTWTFSYNLNLIGQDAFPAGRTQHTSRPDPILWYQNWTLSLQQTTLAPVVVNPFGPYDWPLRPGPEQPPRSIAQGFRADLHAQDLPPGQQHSESVPGPDWRNTWTLNLLQNTLTPVVTTPFGPYDWPNPRPLEQPHRSYNFNFNINLVGQDFFPPGEQYTQRPPGPDWRQGWLHSYNLNLIGQDALPTGEQLSELPPRDHQRSSQLRTWLHSFNLNLRGQDVITIGEQLYDLPPRGHQRQDQQRTWLHNYNLNLIAQDAMVVGKQYTDRPPGPDWRNSWTLNLLQSTLFPQEQRPFGPYDWPNPYGYQQPNKSYQHTFNLNLIDTNILSFGKREWPTPQQPFYPTSNRTWLSSTVELLTRIRPFNQQDWPLPGRAQQPSRSYLHSSLQLQITHRPPFIQTDWPLPQIARQPDRSFQFVPTQLLAQPIVFPAGKQIYDLPPTGHIYPASLRFASNSPYVPEPTPPAGGTFEWIIRARRRHRR